jgi:hypothetical protein
MLSFWTVHQSGDRLGCAAGGHLTSQVNIQHRRYDIAEISSYQT